MKKITFNILSVIAFLLPIIDLFFYIITALCSRDKFTGLSIAFMVFYYMPFGIAELIAYNSMNALFFPEKWTHPKKINRIIALLISAAFMIGYFIYLHKNFGFLISPA